MEGPTQVTSVIASRNMSEGAVMMPRCSVRTIAPLVLVLAASAAACSKGNPASLVAPSLPSSTTTATPGPAPFSTGASISGAVVTGSPSALSGLFRTAGLGSAGRVTVTVNGTEITVVSDDNGNFALQNVPAGDRTLTLAGNGFSAQVTIPGVGSTDQIKVTLLVTGSTATVDDRTVESGNNQGEVEGVINASSNGTIVIGRLNTTVIVPVTATITKNGAPATQAGLVPGARVEVKATKSGETLTALSVDIEVGGPATGSTGNDDNDDNEADDTEVSGTIVAKPVGTCPAVSFTVGTKKVTTNASTRYDKVTCATLAAGDSVSIEGATQKDGSILASEIEKEGGSGGGGKTEVSGTLSGLGGACPARTFTVSGTKVTTNGSTQYDGISCATLANGTKVDVEGTKQPDGSVVATEVGRDD